MKATVNIYYHEVLVEVAAVVVKVDDLAGLVESVNKNSDSNLLPKLPCLLLH